MSQKHAVQENQARQRLLRFSLFTLGGIGLEGRYLQTNEETGGKKPDVSL